MFSDMLQLEYKNLILLSLLRDSLEIKYILKVYKIKPVLYILCADGFWKIGLDFVLFIQIFLASKKNCHKIFNLLIQSNLNIVILMCGKFLLVARRF
jgi:hypothetical protein